MGGVDGKGEHNEDDSGVHVHPRDVIHPMSSSHARESKARQGKGRQGKGCSASIFSPAEATTSLPILEIPPHVLPLAYVEATHYSHALHINHSCLPSTISVSFKQTTKKLRPEGAEFEANLLVPLWRWPWPPRRGVPCCGARSRGRNLVRCCTSLRELLLRLLGRAKVV